MYNEEILFNTVAAVISASVPLLRYITNPPPPPPGGGDGGGDGGGE